MMLKIELGRRETLAANSSGRELAERGLELLRGSEGRAEVCARELTCSSASTLLFRSFISSFISLGEPEKVTKNRTVSKSKVESAGERHCCRAQAKLCCSPLPS